MNKKTQHTNENYINTVNTSMDHFFLSFCLNIYPPCSQSIRMKTVSPTHTQIHLHSTKILINWKNDQDINWGHLWLVRTFFL